jgi:hypothetical protein
MSPVAFRDMLLPRLGHSWSSLRGCPVLRSYPAPERPSPRGDLGVVPCPGEHERGHVGHRAVEPQEQRLRWRHPRPLPPRGRP